MRFKALLSISSGPADLEFTLRALTDRAIARAHSQDFRILEGTMAVDVKGWAQ